MARRIFYLPLFGQLGNQLSVLAHLVGFSMEHNYSLYFPWSSEVTSALNIDRISRERITFSSMLATPIASWLARSVLKIIFLNRNVRVLNLLIINRPIQSTFELINPSPPRIIIVTTWFFRSYAEVKRQKDFIRYLLQLNVGSLCAAKTRLADFTSNNPGCTLVGVHVRRGDYSKWQGGKYYFHLDDYYSFMSVLSLQIPNALFVICSNENFEFENPSKLRITYSKGNALADLFLLSSCEYILGPPSTFSGWAAFAGNSNILFVQNKNQAVSADSFHPFDL